ncbi:helix-turn-helix domain-containing protein [Delftia acidovorans]|uniref:helix-turn-helix domain-containing protein n=1 Tax=Delftia acidovorans TaxID=80866 RepID=UPI003342039C
MVNRLLPISVVAQALGVNRNAVYDLIRHDHLKALKLGSLKVSTFELEDFMRRNAGLDFSDLNSVVPLKQNKTEGDGKCKSG